MMATGHSHVGDRLKPEVIHLKNRCRRFRRRRLQKTFLDGGLAGVGVIIVGLHSVPKRGATTDRFNYSSRMMDNIFQVKGPV